MICRGAPQRVEWEAPQRVEWEGGSDLCGSPAVICSSCGEHASNLYGSPTVICVGANALLSALPCRDPLALRDTERMGGRVTAVPTPTNKLLTTDRFCTGVLCCVDCCSRF